MVVCDKVSVADVDVTLSVSDVEGCVELGRPVSEELDGILSEVLGGTVSEELG